MLQHDFVKLDRHHVAKLLASLLRCYNHGRTSIARLIIQPS